MTTPAELTPGRRIRFVIGAIFVLVAVFVLVLVSRVGDDNESVDSALVGNAAPVLSLTDVSTGEPLRVPNGRITVVNFWAPWCIPCIAEHAELNTAAVTLADRPVDIVGVAIHSNGDEVDEFLERHGSGFPSALDTTTAAIDYGVFGVPETFVVGADGLVKARITGPVDAETVLTIAGELEADGELSPVQPGTTQLPG